MSLSTATLLRRLARDLGHLTGVMVTADYDAPRSSASPGDGWSLYWDAGPTRPAMRSTAIAHCTKPPSVLLLEFVRWERSLGTDEQAAAAILAWMAEHPTSATEALHVDEDELPGWPERLPPDIRRRAATLTAAGWQLYTASPTDAELRTRAARGWTDVAAWLDDLADQQHDATIIPFPGARGTRRGHPT